MRPHRKKPLDPSSPFADRWGFHYPIGATFPAPYSVSDDEAQRAYCQANGFAFYPRTKPEIPVTNRPHPRSYKPDASITPSPTVTLKGQRNIFS